MNIFVIKLGLTPISMLGVSLIARRWGSLVGGLIAGLPLTSGPISIYLAIEQGPAFAARAAEAGLAGTSVTLIAYACYVALTRRFGIPWSCVLSLVAFIVPAFIMLTLDRLAIAIGVSLAAIAWTLHLTGAVEAETVEKAPPLWDLPARLTASTAMVLGVTGFAARMGPALSGILSPIPVIAWPLIVFAHVQGGRAQAIAAVRGTAAGALGILVFYIVVARFVVGHDVVTVYAAALGGSISICGLAGVLLQRHAARHAR